MLSSDESLFDFDELEKLYPDAVNSCSEAMVAARAKLNYYDALNFINKFMHLLRFQKRLAGIISTPHVSVTSIGTWIRSHITVRKQNCTPDGQ